MKIEFYDRKGYNPSFKTIGGEVMMNDICVGRFDWNWPRTKILFDAADDSTHYGSKIFDSFEEAAEFIANSDWFDHDYDRYDGAAHFYFNTKTGYDHIANYFRTFELVKKYTVTMLCTADKVVEGE